MRLYEFTDVSSYTPSANEMGAIIKQVERVWRSYGVEADAPMLCRIIDDPIVEKRKRIDASRD
jgi:hypothetical protein